MFLWRTDKNYLSVITKYPPYLFFWTCSFLAEFTVTLINFLILPLILEINFIFLRFMEVWMQLFACKVGVTFTLHGTHCFHTSMNVRKMKFIPYINFKLCLLCFCSLFVKFWCKCCKIKVINCRVWLLCSTAVSMTWHQWHDISWTLHWPLNYFIYLWHRLRVTLYERL